MRTNPPDESTHQDPVDLSSLRQQVLTAYEEEYKTLYGRFRALDAKAGAIAGSAGVFLAAIFAFAREHVKSQAMVYVLAGALLLLILAVTLCMFATRVRTILERPRGDVVKKFADDVSRAGGPSERIDGFYSDVMRYWSAAIETLISPTEIKPIIFRQRNGFCLLPLSLLQA